MSASNGAALALEPLQTQLHAALKAKSVDLARMYFSALQVLSQANNEDPIVRSEWEYNEVLKQIAPHFQKEDKVELIKLLVEKLRQAILIEEREDDREFRDLSYIWRGSIEDSGQNHDHGIKDTIINWARKLSEDLLVEEPALVQPLCEYLRQGVFPIFSRFAIHLARLSGRADLASKFILDQQLFDCLDVWHEYALLLESGYTNVFTELRDHYLLAIDRIELIDDGKADKPDERLVDHLIALYMYGSFELNSDILTKLYPKIDVRLKKRALDMIGRGLANEKKAPDSEIVKRAVSFWNFRIEECKKLKEPKDRIELSEFGWWLKSGRLDDEWSLDQTIEILKLCHFITPDHMVMERLSELVDTHPVKVAEVLRLMVDHRVTDYGFFGWLDEAKVLLPKLMATEAKDTAVKTIHKLGAYGFNQFGDLLKGVDK